MRYISLVLLLALFSCAAVPVVPDFSNVGQLYRSDGGYGSASPVAYGADGFYVLTCWHVIQGLDGEGFVLHMNGLSYYGGMVVWTDEDSDTALVGFVTEDRPKLYEFAEELPRPYSRGYAAGYPLGVSALIVGDVLFQAHNLINHLTGPGGSGGPVFDEHGKIVGIVSRIRTPGVRPFGGAAMLGWITEMSKLGSAIEKVRELSGR